MFVHITSSSTKPKGNTVFGFSPRKELFTDVQYVGILKTVFGMFL